MSTTKLPPDYLRFFARLTSFELACPRCDKVQLVRSTTNRRIWDPRTARFECMACHQVLRLGVVAWGAGGGRSGLSRDTTPTVREALQLRRELHVWLQTKLTSREDRNILLAELPQVGGLDERGSGD